jgi:hypothetical protein
VSEPSPTEAAEPAEQDRAAKRRLRGFLNHLLAYFALLVVIVPINAWAAPQTPWFLLVMVGWGAPLALHAAHAMGLIGRGRG